MGQNLESAMDEYEVKCKTALRSDYFSVNNSVLAVVCRRQILKNRKFFLKFYLQLVRKRSQKNN